MVIIDRNVILGIRENMKQFLIVIILSITLLLMWLFLIFPFYLHVNIMSICLLMILIYGLAQYYHIMCFITEPGIIPRNHPIYQIPFGKDSYTRLKYNPNIIE